MLSKRFKNDGKPSLHLSQLQKAMQRQVLAKIHAGIYQFRSFACPVCGEQDLDLWAKKDRYGLPFHTGICRVCGLVQSNPTFTQESFNRFYDEEYRPLYVGKPQPTTAFFRYQVDCGKRIYNYLQQSVGAELARMSILEVGCGAGGILWYFRSQGCKVRGVDLGKDYLDFGRREHELDLHHGSISASGDFTPDIIIYSHVLEHIPDPRRELQQARSLLQRNNGWLYVSVPGIYNLRRTYLCDLLRYLQGAHVLHFSLQSLTNLMAIGGFRCIEGSESIQALFRPSVVEQFNPLRSVYEQTTMSVTTLERRFRHVRRTLGLLSHLRQAARNQFPG